MLKVEHRIGGALGMWRNWLVAGVTATALSGAAQAQEVVGSSVVNGRPVQMMSNFTWKYSTPDTSASNCFKVKGNIEFCGQSAGWMRVQGQNDKNDATFRLNDRVYGLFIVENIGSEDGLDQTAMRKVVLQNAANGAGVSVKDIPTFGVEPETVGGVVGETMSYAVNLDNISFIFSNTMLLDKHRSVQIVTYSFGRILTEEARANHKSFLEATRLN